MKKVVILVLALVCLVAWVPWAGLAEEPGSLRGSLVNGTSGGASAADLEVELRIFEGQSESQSLSARTDAQGAFRFDGLQTGESYSYQVRSTYGDVVYSSPLLQFEPDRAELDTELRVYEPTTEYGGIQVGRAHVFVTLVEARLQVTELQVFVNPGDRTYIGTEQLQGRRWTSRFQLPKGSYDLVLEDGSLGGRFLQTDDGFVDTEPLWPGQTSVLFSYVIDCRGSDCDLGRVVQHPISNINVLIPDTGVQLQSQRLLSEGKVEAEGRSYLNYVARDLKPGDNLDVRVRLGRAAAAQAVSGGGSVSLPWILLILLLILLVLGYPFWRRRVQEAAIRDYQKQSQSGEKRAGADSRRNREPR